ncbi:N-acetylmuramic acid 6-phosphate etherase [Streptococcus catagoni]|uniref:N-acetylmuramic acid 6-phosphate etherase n=1 Tax=Streptococcus catagoni TaxID=2654874 RepID=UPI00140DC3CE|nr:N-acetylmuramic acid 6-phosphate etherase [Streptococcus catagoni]
MAKECRETELRNPNTKDFDNISTIKMLELINQEDKLVPVVVEDQLSNIAKLIDKVTESMKLGGRLIYIGAGTSGRLGVLDASECPPTFGVSNNLVVGLIAGGKEALENAIEGAEDSKEFAVSDLQKINLTSKDFLIGLASSGSTPYVVGALEFAQKLGVSTGCIVCSRNSQISKLSAYPIELITGPEVISGSTRLKAGTSQKLVLNMISTCVMTKLGKVYSNYMVDVMATNKKLELRAVRMLVDIMNISESEAEELLEEAHSSVKAALVMKLLNVNYEESIKLIAKNNGHIRPIVEENS